LKWARGLGLGLPLKGLGLSLLLGVALWEGLRLGLVLILGLGEELSDGLFNVVVYEP